MKSVSESILHDENENPEKIHHKRVGEKCEKRQMLGFI
jgi:hypothetical protein